MSYKILNDGRERTPVVFSDVSGLAATRFLDDRKAAGLEPPTADSVKRAQRLIAGNPTMRNWNSPLGLQQLALQLPLTRRERRANRKAIGMELKPLVVRTGDQEEVQVHDAARVEAFVDNNPNLSREELALAIAEMAGYSGEALQKVCRRLDRFGDSRKASTNRICGHLRDKARMLDAISLAVSIRDRRDVEAAAAQIEEQNNAAD